MSVTVWAVFPMNSSEVGRPRPSVMTVKVRSPLTSTSVHNDCPHQRLPIPGLSPNEFAKRIWLGVAMCPKCH